MDTDIAAEFRLMSDERRARFDIEQGDGIELDVDQWAGPPARDVPDPTLAHRVVDDFPGPGLAGAEEALKARFEPDRILALPGKIERQRPPREHADRRP